MPLTPEEKAKVEQYKSLIERGRKVWDDLPPKRQQEIRDLEGELALLEVRDQMEKSTRSKRARGRGRYGERRLAKKVGGVIVGRSKAVKLPSGKYIQINCQKPPDVVTEVFSFESKWLGAVPKSLQKVMTQAISNSPTGLTPVAVIGDREGRVVYYIMTEQDWLDFHG